MFYHRLDPEGRDVLCQLLGDIVASHNGNAMDQAENMEPRGIHPTMQPAEQPRQNLLTFAAQDPGWSDNPAAPGSSGNTGRTNAADRRHRPAQDSVPTRS